MVLVQLSDIPFLCFSKQFSSCVFISGKRGSGVFFGGGEEVLSFYGLIFFSSKAFLSWKCRIFVSAWNAVFLNIRSELVFDLNEV